MAKKSRQDKYINKEIIADDVPESVDHLEEPSAYQLTQSDMLEYGYDWQGMQPMTREEALARYDSGHDVYLLYADGTEGGADSRAEIENFDGIFGFEIADYAESKITEEPTQTESGEGRRTVRSIVFGDTCRDNLPRADGYNSVLYAIKKDKDTPKPPHKAKDEEQKPKERNEI
ncbi:hypothetical protein AGMMS49975_08430 [Clostridia bacterium]|nr:hypothetical protein AGMMS49975_08430 [Clostridia bacterium]